MKSTAPKSKVEAVEALECQVIDIRAEVFALRSTVVGEDEELKVAQDLLSRAEACLAAYRYGRVAQ